MTEQTVYTACDAYGWIDDGNSIQFKAIAFSGDPLDLNPDEAREIAKLLFFLADKLDILDDNVRFKIKKNE